MNFLQLVQRVHEKCRVSGTPPQSVTGTQSADVRRLISWTNDAWMDIQNDRPNWSWMRRSTSFQTAEGQASYTVAQTGADGFGNWNMDTFRVYQTDAGLASEIMLEEVEYDWWRDTYQFSGFRDARTIPVHVTQLPNHGIGLGPAPTAGLTITGDYYAVASEMAANSDIPGLPAQFHMAIVYRAMMFYGASEVAQEILNEGEIEFGRMMRRVQQRELPQIVLGGALL